MRQRLRLLMLLVVGLKCSDAVAIDQSVATRVQSEIAAYARSKGETSEQFAQRIGSPLWHIESFVYDAEASGGTAIEALSRIERFAEALRDPDRRQYLKCIGVRVPRDDDPSLSPISCAVLRRKLGGQ